MVDLRSIAGAELRWLRTGFFPAAFALRWNDSVLATLAWEHVLSSHAIARAGDLAWHIRRHGIRDCLIDDAHSGSPVAILRIHLLGSGELIFADGRALAFRRIALLPPAWSFNDSFGSALVSVHGHVGALLRGGSCRIEPAGAALPEAALVALLGVYVLIRRSRRRARS